MITKNMLIKISPYLWEIPTTTDPLMRVPARLFATEHMLDSLLQDRSTEQLVNVATLPGIIGYALAMPDMHEGYGFPIGGVAATSYPGGIISPGGIGYDINCGVRLLLSQLSYTNAKDNIERLAQRIFHVVPAGVGSKGSHPVSPKELDAVLSHGITWSISEGLATPADARHTESQGHLDNADPTQVSDEAKKRGLKGLGTLGAGNHFLEIDSVEEIYDEKLAQAFGLWKGQMVIGIHCGSRGLGHQVATDHIKIMLAVMESYGIQVKDRQLAGVPLSSKEGTNYFNAMSAAANFAWANRQMITWEVRKAWSNEFGSTQGGELSLLYDVAHNIAKIETHEVNGKKQKLILHRKGATRAFGPGHQELPSEYQATGQPVIIPGSMGTASYVLAGTQQSMTTSLGSCCHGAGRLLSRNAAKAIYKGKALQKELHNRGIYIQAKTIYELGEEAPQAYKDIDEVVMVVSSAGIANKVAKLKPHAVIKG